MASGHYVTALTSICDTDQGFARLLNGLKNLDEKLQSRVRSQSANGILSDGELYRPVQKRMELWAASQATKRTVKLSESAGLIAGEFLYMYPPGIPFVVPGEEIPAGLPERIRELSSRGYDIQGPEDYRLERIKVVL